MTGRFLRAERFLAILGVVLVAAVSSVAAAADITGKWTATFDTQIGQQVYTYDFKVEGEKLTGTLTSNMGANGEIAEGSVKGDAVAFVENFEFQGNKVRIEYKGTVAGDEIKFTRQVGDFATEQLVAKRTK